MRAFMSNPLTDGPKTTWRVNVSADGSPLLMVWQDGQAIEGFSPCSEDEDGRPVSWAVSWGVILDLITNYDVRPEWRS